jgi:uncharacterized membrane protein
MLQSNQVLTYAPRLILLALIAYTFFQWQGLPAQIPTHFNLQGKPDDFGPKGTIFLLPAIGLFLLALFSIVISQLNRSSKVEEKNKTSAHQQRIMMHILSALVMLLFFYITYGTVQVAQGLKTGLSSIFLFGIIALILLTVGFFSWRGNLTA